MSTTHDQPPFGPGPFDDDVLDLEPTVALEMGPSERTGALPRSGAAMGLVEGSLASLEGETYELLRRRLNAAAAALAAIFGLLLVWVFVSENPATLAADGSRLSLRVVLLGLRCLLPVAVAGLLSSEVPLTRKQLRATEYVLFLGLTLLMMVSQYAVGLELMHRGPEYVPMLLAFIKDGVIQMLALMMVYGTLIPNPPAVSARVLLVMFVGPVITMVLLRFNPDAAPIVAQLSAAEEAGSNVLFLAIATALAIYSSYFVNSLRTQLHEATKYGHYQLCHKIGAGGMGEVYMAEHQMLKRPCALKLIRPDAYHDPIALARFEREVRSAARLSHPNTIEIFDYGHTDDGTFYYVMEYLPGLSLGELIKRHGPLPPGRLIYLLRQACAGLAEAHALGLIHRDPKPANIFITVRGGEPDVAKVLDFGLVKVPRGEGVAELTSDQTVSGTPSYMSPEQATGTRDYDARADIYALGAIAYFALTGRPPFEGDSAMAIMIAHARDPVVPPSRLRPEIPADLDQVVLRCLAKRADERYSSVKELGRALAACEAAGDWDTEQAERWWAEVGQGTPATAEA